MPRTDARLAANAALICLPTLVVFALAARFLVVDVPVMSREEKARVFEATEKAAAELRSNPDAADFVWEKGRGVTRGDASWAGTFPPAMSWREWNPATGTKRKDMWGWRRLEGGGRLVWTRGTGDPGENMVWGAVNAKIEERDWALRLYLFVPAFLAVLAGVTCLGVKYFADYVRTRDDFMSATAHDLSTPLVAMRNLIGVDDAEAKCLNERMIRIVCNVRDFLALGGRRRPPEPSTFDLVAAFDEAYALFRDDYRDIFDGKDIEKDVSALDGGGRLPVFADETTVIQILWNLVGNDLKYAAPFGPVRAVFSVSGGFGVLELADEGKGMSRYEMSRAFDRYYRARSILESGKGGFGIGLCTSREFAAANGGSLSVRGNSPRGCVFTLKLPLSAGSFPPPRKR